MYTGWGGLHWVQLRCSAVLHVPVANWNDGTLLYSRLGPFGHPSVNKPELSIVFSVSVIQHMFLFAQSKSLWAKEQNGGQKTCWLSFCRVTKKLQLNVSPCCNFWLLRYRFVFLSCHNTVLLSFTGLEKIKTEITRFGYHNHGWRWFNHWWKILFSIKTAGNFPRFPLKTPGFALYKKGWKCPRVSLTPAWFLSPQQWLENSW